MRIRSYCCQFGPTGENNIEWVIGFSSLDEEFKLSYCDVVCFSDGWTVQLLLCVVMNYLQAQFLEDHASLVTDF